MELSIELSYVIRDKNFSRIAQGSDNIHLGEDTADARTQAITLTQEAHANLITELLAGDMDGISIDRLISGAGTHTDELEI